MGQTIRLEADDGVPLGGYQADPVAEARGAVVVVQEVFGVNRHIRDVCDRFAAAGYRALAPALFDRIRPGVELDYDETGITDGRALVSRLGWDQPIRDVRAAARALATGGKVGVVGYCWGGTIAFLAGCRIEVACVAAYYGRQIVDFPDDRPRCPMIMHFGAADPLIPLDAVETVRARYPDVPVHLYEGAGHGFNCDARADYRADAAALALERTLALFARHLD
jgi:carboxymethylenebutenolidase